MPSNTRPESTPKPELLLAVQALVAASEGGGGKQSKKCNMKPVLHRCKCEKEELMANARPTFSIKPRHASPSTPIYSRIASRVEGRATFVAAECESEAKADPAAAAPTPRCPAAEFKIGAAE
jgi:hypothetical protein